ncbi:MAG: hypothetical protein ABSF56_00490 [Minisyncoccia bacterium]|jgi:type II secretory pathway pseudopilin PulG
MNRGFTVVELVISAAIFIFMTALIVSKYGNFNQSTLLTDTAYDLALVLHTAQTYGISVRNASSTGSTNFTIPYGVDFYNSATGGSCGSATSNSNTIVFFADVDTNASTTCTVYDNAVTVYTLTRGALVNSLCVTPAGSGTCGAVTRLDIFYQRPNPEASICGTISSTVCNYPYAEIGIRGTDGSIRTIVVRQNGQISVQR